MLMNSAYCPPEGRSFLGAQGQLTEKHSKHGIGSLLRDRMLSALAKGRGEMDWSAIGLGAAEDAGLEIVSRK